MTVPELSSRKTLWALCMYPYLIGKLHNSALVFANTFYGIRGVSLLQLQLVLKLTHLKDKKCHKKTIPSLFWYVHWSTHQYVYCSYSGLQFLKLFFPTLHGQVFSLIQAMLQILDRDFQVLLHPLQMRTGVLLLLQLLCHHGSLYDGKVYF